MKSILQPILSNNNLHNRDKNIQFFEKGHHYSILTDPNNQYTSVTTWNHEHFPKFDTDGVINNMFKGKGWKEGHKYWGKTPEQIKELWENNKNNVASFGTDLHYEIECFMNNSLLNNGYTNKELYHEYLVKNPHYQTSTSLEWQYFINFVKDHPELKPYRTEWLIYDEDVKIAGSIDMIYENPDGTLSIYDWKRSKNITRINYYSKFALNPIICHLPDSNFWHYAMQLNTYKFILEKKYDRKIKDLYLVRLHPEAQEKNYELISLPDLSDEIEDLFSERKKQLC